MEHPCKCDICYGARDAEIARVRNAEHLRFTDARKDVAIWMIANGVATGHGDTLDDLLRTLVAHCAERALRVTANRYGEKSEDWQIGFCSGGNAAACAVSEIINPQQPCAAK